MRVDSSQSASAGAQSPQPSIFHTAEPAERQATESVSVGDDPHLRARTTDPETSKKAAKRAALFAKGHASRILRALEDLGSGTAHEVAKETGLSVVQVDRRRHELVKAGKVRLLTDLAGKPIERDGFNVMARTAA